MIDSIGIVNGRFQILHNDHMRYFFEAMKRCEHLIIGITNPDATLTRFSANDPQRNDRVANPLTYFERFQMIKGSLVEAGVEQRDFDIVPFPISHPEVLFNYVPRKGKFYLTIYDAWGYEKKRILQNAGCDIEILWEKSIDEKSICGTSIRQMIANHDPWEEFVPMFVKDYVVENRIDKRIINLVKEYGKKYELTRTFNCD